MAHINQTTQVGAQIHQIRVTRSLSPFISKCILYFLVFWPFIWENGRQRYANAQLIQLPSTIFQFFEPFVIATFLIIVLLHLKNTDFWGYIAVFAVFGCISGIWNGSDLRAIFEVTYKAIRPLLVLFIVTNLKLEEKYRDKTLVIFFTLATINTLLMGYQYVYAYIDVDLLCGLMQDAHTYTNFMFIMLFFYFTYILVMRRYRLLFLSGFFLVAVFLPQHQKAVVIGLGIILVGFLFFIVAKKHLTPSRFVLIVILIALMSFGAYQAVQMLSPTTIPILELAWSNLGDLGFIHSFFSLMTAFAKQPSAILLGLGPGRYGSVYATIGRYASETARSSLGQEVYASFLLKSYGPFGNRGSLFWGSTVVIAILSEYGIIGFFCVVLVFGKLLRVLFSIFRESTSQSLVYQSYGCILGIGFIILLAFVDLGTGYEIQSNIFPQMIMGGLLYSSNTVVRSTENNISA